MLKCHTFNKIIFNFLQIAKRDITESLRDELSGDFLDALLVIGLCPACVDKLQNNLKQILFASSCVPCISFNFLTNYLF